MSENTNPGVVPDGPVSPTSSSPKSTPEIGASVDVTIVMPIQSQRARIEEVLRALGPALEERGLTWDCILVFDGIKGEALELGARLQRSSRDQVRTIALHRQFGESVCLSSAFEHAKGALILTTPPYIQIDPAEISRLTEAVDDGADLVATWRVSRVDSKINQFQSAAFNWVVRKLVGSNFHDLNSTLRVMRREVLEQLTVYGNMYRYLPAVAHRQGFRVDEVKVRHLHEWGGTSIFGPGLYLRRALDLLGLMFLTRFTHKPLRFFGSLGGLSMAVGLLLVGIQLFGWMTATGAEDQSLYLRAPFLVGVLLGVLGAQVIGFGLVGEIIIFTQARNVREYRIERIYE